ncbi:uncharacterized protein [Anoplolepis gracilipes]|uniref:uncharacterized protein n=1 Tax=Anoplolepis gracilipes TaxID=354296 RepID=UPI003BA09C2B
MLCSDNATTTFVGVSNQLTDLKKQLLKEATQRQICEYLSEHFIEWKFIPPYSLHVDGLWEAAVKSAKTHMQKIMGTKILNFKELYTSSVQIEACLNSRSITPLSNDVSHLQALTPGHFIIGEALTTISDNDIVNVLENRLTRYQLLMQIRQHFWNIWLQKYMSQL